ncbi:MAG: hypothetical protein ACRD9R_16840 [Pyrinomonadaceae bacterium]
MVTRIEGVYRNGRIELIEQPGHVPDETRVIVTFIEADGQDLSAHGIDEAQAAELRNSFAAFTDWDSPEMDVYDDYDAAKTGLPAR